MVLPAVRTPNMIKLVMKNEEAMMIGWDVVYLQAALLFFVGACSWGEAIRVGGMRCIGTLTGETERRSDGCRES